MPLFHTSWSRIITSGIIGIVLGVLFLHPAAMFIIDFHGHSTHFNWNAFKLVFSMKHFAMNVYFAYLGGFVGIFFGIINTKLMQTKKRLKQLERILPICPVCKKLREDDGSWETIENHINHHIDPQFSSRICEQCEKKHFPQKIK